MPSAKVIEHPSLLEVGGYDITLDIAESGSTVIEPVPWESFVRGNTLDVLGTVARLHPHVVWVHGREFEETSKPLTLLLNKSMGAELSYIKKRLRGRLGGNLVFSSSWRSMSTPLRTTRASAHFVLVFSLQNDKAGHPALVAEHESPQPALLGGSSATPGNAISLDAKARVPKPIQMALTRLHQNLGHPRVEDMTRHLRYAGAEDAVLRACKAMRCEVCARNQRTKVQLVQPHCLPSWT